MEKQTSMDKNTKQQRKFISVEDFAKELDLSTATIRRYIKNGKIKASKIGKKYHIPKTELDKLVKPETAPSGPDQRKISPRKEPKSDLRYNSLVGETLAEIADDLKSVDELEEIITQLDSESLPIFNKVKGDKKDPLQVIADFLGLEAQINLASRREMVKYLQKNEALVFLPLPPHIFETVITSVSDKLIFNSEDKEPAHIAKHHVPKLNSGLEVIEKYSDMEVAVTDGQIINNHLIVRENVAAVLSFLMKNNLKKIFFHRIPHLPKKQNFVKLSVDRSRISIFFL